MNLFELLSEYGVITADDRIRFEKYLSEQKGAEVSSPEQLLIKSGVEPSRILETLGAYYKVATRLLGEQEKIEPSVLQHVPVDSARHYKLVPLCIKDGVLEVGCLDPDNLD
ncbi:MAG: Type secretion system protein N-terminal domain, partial [Candidatus Parcubacteria bacterium]